MIGTITVAGQERSTWPRAMPASALWQITNDGGSWLSAYDTFRFEPDSYSTFSVQLDSPPA